MSGRPMLPNCSTSTRLWSAMVACGPAWAFGPWAVAGLAVLEDRAAGERRGHAPGGIHAGRPPGRLHHRTNRPRPWPWPAGPAPPSVQQAVRRVWPEAMVRSGGETGGMVTSAKLPGSDGCRSRLGPDHHFHTWPSSLQPVHACGRHARAVDANPFDILQATQRDQPVVSDLCPGDVQSLEASEPLCASRNTILKPVVTEPSICTVLGA